MKTVLRRYPQLLAYALAAALIVAGVAQLSSPAAFVAAGLLVALPLLWRVPDA